MTIGTVRPAGASFPYARPRGPEAQRLDLVKRAVRADLADDRPAELATKRVVAEARVTAAQSLVRLAKGWFASAATPAAYWANPAGYAQAWYAVKGAEAELRTAYAMRAAVKAGPANVRTEAPIRPVAPVTKVAPIERPGQKGAAVWREPGVWVANADAFPADHAIPKLKAAGVKWVTLQIADGTTLNEQTVRQLNAGFIQKCQAAGIKVGFWGVNRTQPEAEARLMAEQCKRWGAAFFIANAEMEYKYTGPDGSPAPEAYGRSQRFVKAFREAAPTLTAALSSYGRADMADLDWKVWRENGFDWLPQAYLNDFATCDPALCVEGAVKAGWPKDRVHPTIGLWGGGQSRLVPASEYEASLRRAGSVGLSSYLGEQMSEADWQGLGRMIAKGGLTA